MTWTSSWTPDPGSWWSTDSLVGRDLSLADCVRRTLGGQTSTWERRYCHPSCRPTYPDSYCTRCYLPDLAGFEAESWRIRVCCGYSGVSSDPQGRHNSGRILSDGSGMLIFAAVHISTVHLREVSGPEGIYRCQGEDKE